MKTLLSNSLTLWLLPWLLATLGQSASAVGTNQGEILLGMSTALTGPAANLCQEMQKGVLAKFNQVNRTGGVNGRLLRLITLDDGYEPSRTGPNMRRLLEKEHVVAVIGNFGTSTAIVSVPIASEQRTLFFAPGTGAGVVRKDPPDRYVFNFRASYAEEINAMVDGLIDGARLRCEDIAIFTQRDGYGDAGFDATIEALKRHGLKNKSLVSHVGYGRNSLAVEDALATLLYADHEPRAVIMVGIYAPCAKFIRLAQEAGLKAIFLNVSFVGSNQLAAELGRTSAKVIVTQVVPHPLESDAPVVREYQNDLLTMDATAMPDFGSLEGYISACVLVRAFTGLTGNPTRETAVEAFEKLGQFDIGLGQNLKLGPKEHQACHSVWPTMLREGKFVPFRWDQMGSLSEKAGEQ